MPEFNYPWTKNQIDILLEEFKNNFQRKAGFTLFNTYMDVYASQKIKCIVKTTGPLALLLFYSSLIDFYYIAPYIHNTLSEIKFLVKSKSVNLKLIQKTFIDINTMTLDTMVFFNGFNRAVIKDDKKHLSGDSILNERMFLNLSGAINSNEIINMCRDYSGTITYNELIKSEKIKPKVKSDVKVREPKKYGDEVKLEKNDGGLVKFLSFKRAAKRNLFLGKEFNIKDYIEYEDDYQKSLEKLKILGSGEGTGENKKEKKEDNSIMEVFDFINNVTNTDKDNEAKIKELSFWNEGEGNQDNNVKNNGEAELTFGFDFDFGESNKNKKEGENENKKEEKKVEDIFDFGNQQSNKVDNKKENKNNVNDVFDFSNNKDNKKEVKKEEIKTNNNKNNAQINKNENNQNIDQLFQFDSLGKNNNDTKNKNSSNANNNMNNNTTNMNNNNSNSLNAKNNDNQNNNNSNNNQNQLFNFFDFGKQNLNQNNQNQNGFNFTQNQNNNLQNNVNNQQNNNSAINQNKTNINTNNNQTNNNSFNFDNFKMMNNNNKNPTNTNNNNQASFMGFNNMNNFNNQSNQSNQSNQNNINNFFNNNNVPNNTQNNMQSNQTSNNNKNDNLSNLLASFNFPNSQNNTTSMTQFIPSFPSGDINMPNTNNNNFNFNFNSQANNSFDPNNLSLFASKSAGFISPNGFNFGNMAQFAKQPEPEIFVELKEQVCFFYQFTTGNKIINATSKGYLGLMTDSDTIKNKDFNITFKTEKFKDQQYIQNNFDQKMKKVNDLNYSIHFDNVKKNEKLLNYIINPNILAQNRILEPLIGGENNILRYKFMYNNNVKKDILKLELNILYKNVIQNGNMNKSDGNITTNNNNQIIVEYKNKIDEGYIEFPLNTNVFALVGKITIIVHLKEDVISEMNVEIKDNYQKGFIICFNI